MTKLGYLRSLYDEYNDNCFDTSLSLTATIFIKSANIKSNTLEQSKYSDGFDARHQNSLKVKYPLSLERTYTVPVLLVDNYSLKATEKYNTTYTKMGNVEPFDIWISCKYADVEINRAHNKTYFDYADYVSVSGEFYEVRNLVKETFGVKPVVHIFLAKRGN